jgi:hypothetical protein
MPVEEQVASKTEQVAQTTVSPATENKVENTTSETPKEEVKATLTEERVQQLIAEAQAKAIEDGKMLGKREMQAIKDREVAAEKRRAELAERKAKIYEGSFNDLDDEAKAQLELRRLRGETELYKQREQEDSQSRQQQEYISRLEQSLKDEVNSYGVDPTDKRIDYAKDAPNYFDGRKRFTESLARIVRENRESAEKNLKMEMDTKFKQMESDFRKKYGLDSHDTTSVTGVMSQSDADFMKAYGNYELPASKENIARYDQIKKKYY